MDPTKKTQQAISLRWVGIALVMLVLGNWAIGQYYAYYTGYILELDPHMIKIENHYIFYPFQWILWVYMLFGKSYLQSSLSLLMISALGWSFLCVVFAFVMQYKARLNSSSEVEGLHGSAHFATDKEVEATGLLKGEGVYVGAYVNSKGESQYLRHNGPEHILAFAPTRSGKGVGLVLPTLLSWRGSVLVHDIKGENYAVTAGWRKAIGQRILKFAPTEENSVRFNPLQEIRIRTKDEVKDAQNIATMIVDPDGKGLNDHWAKTGFALLVGAILHQLYSGKDKTLRGVANMLSDPSVESVDQIFEQWINTEHDPDLKMGWKDPTTMRPTKVHPAVAANAREMLNKADNEKSGVISTAMSFLSLYRDNMVARNTEVSDFTINDLMNLDEPCSLFLVVPPSDKDRLKPLIRLVVNQVVRTLTEKMEFKGGTSVAHYKHRLLLLIDEFPALGKLDIFAEALAFIAGYGLKAYLITQDLSQLYAAYTKDESIVSNCHIRIAYAPNKIETAELLSKMTGKTTIKNVSNSYSGNVAGPYLGNVSSSVQDVGRELMTTDEVLSMPPSDSLIFVAGFPVIRGKKILYFKDKVFSQRSKFSTDVLDSRGQILLDRLRNEKGELVSKQVLTMMDEGKIPLWADLSAIDERLALGKPIDDLIETTSTPALPAVEEKEKPLAIAKKKKEQEADQQTWSSLADRRRQLRENKESVDQNIETRKGASARVAQALAAQNKELENDHDLNLPVDHSVFASDDSASGGFDELTQTVLTQSDDQPNEISKNNQLPDEDVSLDDLSADDLFFTESEIENLEQVEAFDPDDSEVVSVDEVVAFDVDESDALEHLEFEKHYNPDDYEPVMMEEASEPTPAQEPLTEDHQEQLRTESQEDENNLLSHLNDLENDVKQSSDSVDELDDSLDLSEIDFSLPSSETAVLDEDVEDKKEDDTDEGFSMASGVFSGLGSSASQVGLVLPDIKPTAKPTSNKTAQSDHYRLKRFYGSNANLIKKLF